MMLWPGPGKMVVRVGNGVLATVLSSQLGDASDTAIGMVAAALYAGLLLCSLVSTRVIRRLGHRAGTQAG